MSTTPFSICRDRRPPASSSLKPAPNIWTAWHGNRAATLLQQELAQGYLKIGDVEGYPYGANLGDTDKSIETYRKALGIPNSMLARDPKSVAARQVAAKSHLDLAFVLPAIGEVSEAFEHATQSVKLYDSVLADDSRSPAAKLDLEGAWERQGDLLGGPQEVNLGRTADSVAAYRHAEGLIPELPAGHPLAGRASRAKAVIIAKLAMTGIWRGSAGRTGNVPGGIDHGGESIARRSHQPARPRIGVGVSESDCVRPAEPGRFSGALESYRQATASDEAELAADPNNSKARDNAIVTLRNLGSLYLYELHKNNEGLAAYRRAAELLEAVCHSDPHNVAARRDSRRR